MSNIVISVRASSTFAPRLRAALWLTAALLLALPLAAGAQSRRSRLPEDLRAHLRNGDVKASRVIVTGSAERIAAIAARHGVRVRRWLDTGAVIEVPAGELGSLADDNEVDELAADQVVRSHMAITNATIGADLVQAGTW